MDLINDSIHEGSTITECIDGDDYSLKQQQHVEKKSFKLIDLIEKTLDSISISLSSTQSSGSDSESEFSSSLIYDFDESSSSTLSFDSILTWDSQIDGISSKTDDANDDLSISITKDFDDEEFKIDSFHSPELPINIEDDNNNDESDNELTISPFTADFIRLSYDRQKLRNQQKSESGVDYLNELIERLHLMDSRKKLKANNKESFHGKKKKILIAQPKSSRLLELFAKYFTKF